MHEREEPRTAAALDRRLDRRRFLQVGGAGTLAWAGTANRDGLALTSGLFAPGADVALDQAARGPAPDHSVVLRRRDDQLHLRLDFWNLALTKATPRKLYRKAPRPPCLVVVHFPPQHIAEQAVYLLTPTTEGQPKPPDEPTMSEEFPALPVGHRVAGDTRLVFSVPEHALPLPYTWDALMDWTGWTPVVVPSARASAAIEPMRGGATPPVLRPPTVKETSIELPWWLQISPHKQTTWVHQPQPVTRDGRTELWHTRLAGRAPGGDPDEHDTARKTIRAVWARDPKIGDYLDRPLNGPPVPPDGEDFHQQPLGMPFRTALSPLDRADLVTSTADFAHRKPGQGQAYVPLPVQVDRLTLSPGGAWFDASAAWRAGVQGAAVSGTSLEAWRHIAADGRDQYVRIVRKGCCFPVPFRGSLFKVTERTFRTVGTGTRTDPWRRVAYMVQRYFIVIRRREVVLGGPLQPSDGRRFPFQRVRTRTLVTPVIDAPQGVPEAGLGATEAFVIAVGGQPFHFDVEGTDHAQRPIDLATPLLFVDATAMSEPGKMAELIKWYHKLNPQDPLRALHLGGQRVAVAEPNEPGDTDLDLHRFTLGAEPPLEEVDDEPWYFPTMAETEVRLTTAEAALGGPVESASGLPVMRFNDLYCADGFAPGDRPGEVFVELVDPAATARLGFGAAGKGDRGGGVIAPDVGIRGVSRSFGVIGGDPVKFDDGDVQATDYFGDMPATLLGDVPLASVIAPADLKVAGDRERVIRVRSTSTPDALVTEVTWHPAVQNSGPFLASHSGGPASLELIATITAPTATPAAPTTVVRGDLRNFTVRLLEGVDAHLVDVEFDRLRFRSESGAKPDIDVEIRQVVFAGALEFVNDLRDYLDFSVGGFSIDVQPTRLDAGFELPIPSIPLGIFSIQNVAFVAGVTVPFTGESVRFRFGFSTADDPFLVSVMIFGGGGFFELGLSAGGVESFQASLEFGIVGALDFGVASGSVSVTAGIYLALGIETPENPHGKPELTGFIKIKGEVDVLGLVSLAILLEAGFTYIPKKAIVRATIIVEVDVLLFSGEVEIEYEKKFGGSDDPTFRQSLTPLQWSAYRAAFAPIGA